MHKRKLLHLALLAFGLLAASPALAADTYYAPAATGSGAGTSCANAIALPSSLPTTAGNTAHICGGTYTGASGATSFLSIANSGTSGNPITVIADQGAVTFTSTNWAGPVINLAGHSYVTINGVSANNWTIQSTLNGTSGAACIGGPCSFQSDDGVCVNNGGSSSVTSNVTVEFINCQKLYLINSVTDNGGEDTYAFDLWSIQSLTVANNTCKYVKWCTRFPYAIGLTFASPTLTMYGNNFSDMDHGVFAGASDSSGTVTIGKMLIYGNTFGSMTAWDNTDDNNHHDWVHISSNGANGIFLDVEIYNNVAIGDVGANANAAIYLAQDSGSLVGAAVNNVFVNTATGHCWANGFLLENENALAFLFANNTMVSNAIEHGCTNNGESLQGDNGIVYDSSSHITAENNVFVSMKNNNFYSEGSTSITAINYNDWYNGAPYWTWAPSGGTGVFATWQSDCACDANSILTNPNLNSSSSPPYQLTNSSSPAYRTGTNLTSAWGTTYPEILTDAAGNPRPSTGAWDMGAYFLPSGGGAATPPSCAPAGGTFSSAQSATCTNPNSGTTVICYAFGATTPATNGAGTGCATGTQYTGAVSIAVNEMLHAIAGTSTLTDSTVVSYAFAFQGSTPMFSPASGAPPLSVTINQAQSLNVCYTTNGSTPASNGSGACSNGTQAAAGSSISVTVNPTTVKAIGMASGWTDSAVGSASYSVTTYTLTVTPTAGGSVSDSKGGIVSCTSTGGTCSASYTSGTEDVLTETPSASYVFTTWGGACSGSASTCSLTITGNTSVSATFAAMTAPSVTTGTAGSITSTGAIVSGNSWVCASPACPAVTAEGVAYGHTVNPTTPCTGSGTATPFSATLTGLEPSTLYYYRACATNSVGTSYGAGSSFTTLGRAPSPSCLPAGGNFTSGQTVTCTDSGATVMCYATGATTPVTNGAGTGCTTGTHYTGAVSIAVNETFNIVGGTSTEEDSTETSYVFAFQGSAPTFSPSSGAPPLSVTINQSQSLNVCYTTNGSTPASNGSGACSNGTQAAAGSSISVSADPTTVKAIAMASGWTDSTVASASYSVTTYTLTVTPTVGGSISDSAGGIVSCTSAGGTCSATYPSGTNTTLTETPSAGYVFTTWGGACSGSAATCSLTITGNTSVTATFSSNTLATVTTGSAGSVTMTGAVISGNSYTCTGSCATVSHIGVCYGTSPNPTTSGTCVNSASLTTPWNATITGLTNRTLYYYRAYAVNSVGTSYGSDLQFTTQGRRPWPRHGLVY
jgi:uncharacterized repeat protein (TIGR02543 family)